MAETEERITRSTFSAGVMTAWIEVKRHVLPWLVAAAFLAVSMHGQSRQVVSLENANERLVAELREVRAAMRATNDLLATQGYTLPPQTGALAPP